MAVRNQQKHPNVLDDMKSDNVAEMLGHFIVNRLGINLCAVDRIKVRRQSDQQIKEIVVKFIPADDNNNPNS